MTAGHVTALARSPALATQSSGPGDGFVTCRPDDGFVGGAEGLFFGLLLFVVGTLLVGNAWSVVDTKLAVDAASREATRTYVEAPDAAAADVGARRAATATLQGYGRDPTLGSVVIDGAPFGRCVRVTVVVSYRAPLVQLPVIGVAGRAEKVSAQHSELVDPYRSGLPGASTCG
ncbi:hypothetical protein K6U06_05990 [Acidiferrimicrobium sp. IK]|uniref:hypothetical protein n=1 Tax=Acidiferrimicrobium sp. IK TaxID=2871700 RepID=UPI0021CB1B05|nr:hypothetical protein [Acidiferrimicrobium sp. IK]MCU4183904.1 hypothetical protein [Acidiferrimicrobium sp. IK]